GLRSAPPAHGAEPGQCRAQQAVEGSVLERRLAQQLLEHGAYLSLAKTELAQRGKDLGTNLDRLRLHVATVLGAVRMANAQVASGIPAENDLAPMGRAVMHGTDAREVVQRVASPFGAQLQMMHVQPGPVLATRNLATALVAQEHRAAQRWGDSLCGSRADAGVARGKVTVRWGAAAQRVPLCSSAIRDGGGCARVGRFTCKGARARHGARAH